MIAALILTGVLLLAGLLLWLKRTAAQRTQAEEAFADQLLMDALWKIESHGVAFTSPEEERQARQRSDRTFRLQRNMALLDRELRQRQ